MMMMTMKMTIKIITIIRLHEHVPTQESSLHPDSQRLQYVLEFPGYLRPTQDL
jgi:tRNA G37 N-methylase TrmD